MFATQQQHVIALENHQGLRHLSLGLAVCGSLATFADAAIGARIVTGLALVFAVTGIARYIRGSRQSGARRLGPYALERELGQGGMGVVYKAEHILLRRPAAIKLLRGRTASDRDSARFEREVSLTSRLHHPNTVRVYDCGQTPDGRFYYAMEYIDGVTLEELVESTGALAPERAIRILSQVAGALAEAHAMGLVHRDVKPANVMVCDHGVRADTVKVLDFGLAKELSTPGAVTETGTIVGTPRYLAPELIAGTDATPAADVYALGAVAYYVLTGRPVFDGETITATCAQHLFATPEPPSRHTATPLDPALDALVLRCLAKEPHERFTDAAALRDALSALGDSTTP